MREWAHGNKGLYNLSWWLAISRDGMSSSHSPLPHLPNMHYCCCIHTGYGLSRLLHKLKLTQLMGKKVVGGSIFYKMWAIPEIRRQSCNWWESKPSFSKVVGHYFSCSWNLSWGCKLLNFFEAPHTEHVLVANTWNLPAPGANWHFTSWEGFSRWKTAQRARDPTKKEI